MRHGVDIFSQVVYLDFRSCSLQNCSHSIIFCQEDFQLTTLSFFWVFLEPLELSNDSFTPIFFTCLRNVENMTGQLSIAVKRDNKVRLRRII